MILMLLRLINLTRFDLIFLAHTFVFRADENSDDEGDDVAAIAEQERKEMEEWLARQKALEEAEKKSRRRSTNDVSGKAK